MLGHEVLVEDLEVLARKGEAGHSLLFFGPEGVGKKTAALTLARRLEGSPREERILSDFLLVGPKEGTIGIDAVRELKAFLWQAPFASPYRTAILDNAECLTGEAQNALLKIAEEPPRTSLLILITSDPDALRQTLLSRFRSIYFPPISEKTVTAWLKNCGAKGEDAHVFAKRAHGKPGLALRMLEDEALKERLEQAAYLLRAAPREREEFIKKLAGDDAFNCQALLEALILILGEESWTKERIRFWHRLLALRESEGRFNLNPKIQLKALFRP